MGTLVAVRVKKTWLVVGYTGVGYKRSAAKSNQNGGTPGYPNGAVIDTDTLADAASVTISEVMYARGRNLPQWIELYNSSTTQAVNLNEWKLKFENADDVDIRTYCYHQQPRWHHNSAESDGVNCQ